MKVHSILVLFFSTYVSCNIINNVRLVNHTSYVINVITRTMNIVEERGWCNLKLPDHDLRLDETILTTPYRASMTYTNGFVSTIQHIDITQFTVQQVWFHNASAASTHTVTVRATMRMHDVAVGYDVVGHKEGDTDEYHYTVVYTHPLISYEFSIIRDLFTNALTVRVVGTVPATTRLAEFRPKDSTSDIFASTFNPTQITAPGMLAWGPEVFQPITSQVVTQEIEFPTICYNCNT